MGFLSMALLLFLPLCCFTEAKNNFGFTARFIHRDSELSPYHDPSLTQFQRAKNAIERSHARIAYVKNSIYAQTASPSFNASSNIYPGPGDYLMEIFLGSNKIQIWAVADTGSTLTWTQCNNNQVGFYYPQNSTTYKNLTCSPSKPCISPGTCTNNICNYLVIYGSGQTSGVLGNDTLYLPTPSGGYTAFPSYDFGCSYSYSFDFNTSYASGIVGLGNSSISILSQLGVSTFSYCLGGSIVDSKYSNISFGSTGVVSGNNTYSTPLVSTTPYYYVNLTGFTINSVFIKNNYTSKSGNIILDSGTTLTYLPPSLATQVNSALESSIACPRYKLAENETRLALCYVADPCFDIQPIVVNFQGANLTLTQDNLFQEVATDVFCSAFQSAGVSGLAIWGNIAQYDFKIL